MELAPLGIISTMGGGSTGLRSTEEEIRAFSVPAVANNPSAVLRLTGIIFLLERAESGTLWLLPHYKREPCIDVLMVRLFCR